MLNKTNLKDKLLLLLGITAITYIIIIVLILITGGYRGSIAGIQISARALLNPVIILVFLLIVRYTASKENIGSSSPMKILLRLRSYVIENPQKAFVLLTLYLIYFKYFQHLGYDTYSHDLSVFDYPIHYTLNGKFMYYPWWGSINNYFGIHFSPILLAIVPIYIIYAMFALH